MTTQSEDIETLKQWIQALTGQHITDILADLKDGKILCLLINQILPNSCKPSQINNAFFHIENINQFLNSAKKLGVPHFDLFDVADLFEGRSLKQVINCLFAVSRHAQDNGFKGPVVGPKLAERQKYYFSEEKLKMKDVQPTLQDGHFVDLSKYTVNDGGIRRQITEDNNYLNNKK